MMSNLHRLCSQVLQKWVARLSQSCFEQEGMQPSWGDSSWSDKTWEIIEGLSAKLALQMLHLNGFFPSWTDFLQKKSFTVVYYQ